MIDPPQSVDPIVEFIARQPGLVARLLTDHVDDGTGHCRVCTAGAQAGRQVSPCRLLDLAEQASKVTRGGPQ